MLGYICYKFGDFFWFHLNLWIHLYVILNQPLNKVNILHFSRQTFIQSSLFDNFQTLYTPIFSVSVCKSVDVRNSLDAFSKLENCEVIEGFLQILLFDNVSESEFLKIQFPLLTEITDYLLLYRVSGLRSIGQLFPNLSVIRGQNLFFLNAFVIFEMSSLQEIGLYSLTDITHGAVRIDKNPSLCFVHTIDWDRIVHDKSEKSFIKSLKPENECPICPGDVDAKTIGENNSVTVACPKAPRTNGENFEKDKHLCWNKRHCQKICPDNCTACNDHGQCCGALCLGGCSNDDPNDCKVCRNFTLKWNNNKKECTQRCPDFYFKVSPEISAPKKFSNRQLQLSFFNL